MDFPKTNKIPQHQELSAEFGANAKLLEDVMKKVDWRWFGRAYVVAFGILLVSLFLLIVVVRFAFVLF